MGTRIDFYVGREWLGSLAFDGYRVYEMRDEDAAKSEDNRCCARIKHAKTEADYRAAVRDLLAINDDATTPEQGWPWPWADSRATDCACVFDGTSSRFYSWGNENVIGDDEAAGPEPDGGWPDMSAVQNVTTGTMRAGNIVIVSK